VKSILLYDDTIYRINVLEYNMNSAVI